MFDEGELYKIADAALSRFDYDAALAALLKIAPSADRDVLIGRAQRLRRRYDLARRFLEPFRLERSDAAFEYGMTRLHEGYVDEAKTCFEHSLELGPSADAYGALAFLEERRSRGRKRDDLYALFDDAFALDADNVGVLQTFGIARLHDGEAQEALTVFRRVLDGVSAPEQVGSDAHFDALCNAACALTALRQHDDALDHLDAALAAAPSRPFSSMRIRADEHLKALHEFPRFWELVDRPTQDHERTTTEPASILPKLAMGAASAKVYEFASSGRHADVEAACHVLATWVEDRWGAYGDIENCCPAIETQSIIDHSGRLIAQCLRDTAWLRAHFEESNTLDAPLPRHGLSLLSALLNGYSFGTSGDPLAPLQLRVAQELVPLAVSRWASVERADEARFPTEELLEILAMGADGRDEPDYVRRPLCTELGEALAKALDGPLSARIRAALLKALAAQAGADEKDVVAALLESDDADEVHQGLVAQIGLDRKKVDYVRWFARSEKPIRELMAAEFGAKLGPRVRPFWDECDEEAKERLVLPLLGSQGRGFATRVVDYCRTGKQLRAALLWLQKTDLAGDDLLAFVRLRPTLLPGNAPERTRSSMAVGVLRSHRKRLRYSAEEAGLPDESIPPSVFTASVVGYLGVRSRAGWLRKHLPAASTLTTEAIIESLALVGDKSDLVWMRKLSARNETLDVHLRMARMLLGDSAALLDEVQIRRPFHICALERLFDEHWPKERERLWRAVDGGSTRGLGNGEKELFERIRESLRKRMRAR